MCREQKKDVEEKGKIVRQADPDAHLLFHSDRGFQYTNRSFHTKPEAAGMTMAFHQKAATVVSVFLGWEFGERLSRVFVRKCI